MNILDAIADANLFQPFLGQNTATWQSWLGALACVYGLPVPRLVRPIVRQCTGRKVAQMPSSGFDTALFLTGRRSGKSRVAAIVGAYEACLAGHDTKLAKGEKGVVAVCAPTTKQGHIVRDYIRAVFDAPLLQAEVESETREGFDLASGTRIEILAGDWRTVRGYTLIAAVVDEACFFGYDAESKIRSDSELIRAIKPSLATVGGKLVCISTPYARKGWCYSQWKKGFGNDAGKVLV
jgi:phage terminase large subunit-like protein